MFRPRPGRRPPPRTGTLTSLLSASLCAALLACAAPAARAVELTVSAASSLSNAFRALAPAFEARHPGTTLQLNFAASDTLLAQIARGAPVDVFAAADQDSMDRAERQGLLAKGSRHDFAANTLVLVTPAQGGLALASLADLRQPAVRRIALGKPEGVPAGRYARAALQAAQLWDALAPKAVYAQNVRQALDYVARGEVEAGLVYGSDALAQSHKVQVRFSIPTPTPIRYPAARIEGSTHGEAAAQFLAYLRSPAGQALLAQHGFLPP